MASETASFIESMVDRQYIANMASQMKSKEDLLNLLNLIKKAEIEEKGLDVSMYHPFTENNSTFIVIQTILFIVIDSLK